MLVAIVPRKVEAFLIVPMTIFTHFTEDSAQPRLLNRDENNFSCRWRHNNLTEFHKIEKKKLKSVETLAFWSNFVGKSKFFKLWEDYRHSEQLVKIVQEA